MKKQLLEKLKEALYSVLPVTLIVLLLQCFFPMPKYMLIAFLMGAVLLIIGMCLFTLGAETAMMPMAERIGSNIVKSGRYWILIPLIFIIGTIITIAEPDLQVLANQFSTLNKWVVILVVACGVGVFLVIAMIRVLKQVDLTQILLAMYVLVFALAGTSIVSNPEMIPVAFDSGGVTTGPITVPFLMALGIGFATVRGSKSAQDDSFGIVGLCSIGPIIAMLILGLASGVNEVSSGETSITVISSFGEVLLAFYHGFVDHAGEVLQAIMPIVVLFILFQLIFLHLPKTVVVRVGIGLAYTFAGLVIFLAGVNIGFMSAGTFIGSSIASSNLSWLLLPLGMILGFFVVMAEPAVKVLNKQVEELTVGAISQSAMLLSLSIGVAISLGLSMLRVLTGISVWYFIVPCYALAIELSFLAPKMFTVIAFDSGGVASGPMTATFMLPFAMGACKALGGNITTDAFGLVAMVAVTPLITIQVMGIAYKLKLKRSANKEIDTVQKEIDSSIIIIEFEIEGI